MTAGSADVVTDVRDRSGAGGGPAVVFPPMVYVPCAPPRAGSGELSVDMRETRDGRLALLVYSALDRLVACCGPGQAWTVMPAAGLEAIRVETGFELVLLDVDVPEEFRRTAGHH